MSTILERILKLLVSFIGWPDWSDSESVRKFVQTALGLLDKLADATATTLDDAVIDVAKGLVANDEQWAVIYSILSDLFNWDADKEVLDGDPRVYSLADDAKVDPTIIITIITVIWELYKWWKDHKEE